MCRRSSAATRKKLFSLALPGRRTNRSKCGVAHDGSVALSQRRQARPLPHLRARLALAERRLHEGEQHISQQETVITQFQREGRDLALALSVLDTLIETQKAHLQERDLIVTEVAKRFG